ncbi:hypothetical protein LTR53_000964 [Teratosphaeriaceae sp. CCFEE 6253]|nr:hypothetical protein LTR53_000964 [Teratosphaeriaceae sp. CCFEE 6253]
MSTTATGPNSEKGRRYFAQLDEALCNARWSEIGELARKTDKHAPERGCFTLAARTEAQIASASHRPTSASSTGTSSIHSIGEAVPKLQQAVESGKSAADDVYCARACLAEIHWLQEDARRALAVLPSGSTPGGGQTAALGWLEVCTAKIAFIRAAALEADGRGAQAREVHRTAVSQTPGSRTPELRRWNESLLARACMSSYGQGRAAQPTIITLGETLAHFQAWSRFWQRASPPASSSGISPTRVDVPRRRVWKAYYDLLSTILRHDLSYDTSRAVGSEAVLIPTRELSDHTYLDAKTRQRAELKRVEAAYESLLLDETQFPQATETNVEVEEWIEQAVENWKILSSADWTDQEIGEGGKAVLGRGMLDILYRASTKTFHSTAILRQLFTVHAALGEFELAIHAFNSYAEIVGKAKARAEKTGKHELGSNNDDLALLTAAEAIRVLCRYGDRAQAEKAVEVGKTVKEWLGRHQPSNDEELQTSEDTKTSAPPPPDRPTASIVRRTTLAAAYRAIGISQAHWARLTYDTDGRAGLQKSATANLQRARTFDDKDIETAYALARVLAETQNVPAAIDVIKRAMAASNAAQSDDEVFDNSYARQRQLVPMWHSLALCLTARDEHEAAAKMCEAAFDQFGDSEVLFGRRTMQTLRTSGPPSRAERGLVDTMDDFEKEALLQIKLSQLTLIELMEGAERAADFSDEVLRLYARLFGSPEQLKRTSEPPQATASVPMPTPSRGGGGTLRSIAGSIRPKSARQSAEKPRQVTNDLTVPSGTNVGSHTATNGQATGAPISITVTNEDGDPAEKSRHDHHHRLHLPFKMRGHHGDFRAAGSLRSKKSAETLNEKTVEGVQDGANSRPPVPPKDTSVTDHAHTATDQAAAADHSISTGAPTTSQQPLKVSGHETNPPEQDVRLPAPHPVTSHGPTISSVGTLQQSQHRTSILVNVWLFVSALYIRAGFHDDAAGAVEEAKKLVEAFEAEKAARRANAEKLFLKGWGGGKSVDELWADVWSTRGGLALARELPFEALEAYERCLDFFPDHPEGIIGIADILMDIYEEKMPAEEPEPPLFPPDKSSRSAFTNPAASSSTAAPTPLTTSKSSLLSPGRGLPPNARRSKDPTPAQLNRLAERDRAYMLLSSLTKLGTGWDNPEAWFTLARAYELSREVGQAKRALWWVVELEESKPMRPWGVSSPGGYAL